MRRGFTKNVDQYHIKERNSSEKGIGSSLLSLSILQALAIGWQSLTFVFMALLLPHSLLPIGVIGAVIGISITAAAVLRGRSLWVRFSLLDAWLVLFLIQISQAFTQSVAEYLPITLLGFVMVLFEVELLTDDGLYQRNSTTKITKRSETAMDEEFFRRSVQQTFRRVSRLGLLFASCYLASLGILYLAAFAPLTIPLIADISLYIVVVSVALALLILLREDRK